MASPKLFGRNSAGDAVWPTNQGDSQEILDQQQQFRDEVRSDSRVKKFEEVYGNPFDDPNFSEIAATLQVLYPGFEQELASPMFIDAVQTTFHGAADRLTPLIVATPTPAPPAPERPRDRNGKSLTDAQIRWSEYRQWSDTHSAAECRARAASDAGYADFRHKQYEREMTRSIGDPVESLTTRQDLNATLIDEHTAEFVRLYQQMSAQEVRNASRADTNPFGYIDFNSNVQRAIDAGLL